MKYKKTIVAAIAVAVVSVALGASFNTSTQHLQAAINTNHVLTVNSSTTNLSGYFRTAYQTRSSLELGLTPTEGTADNSNLEQKCEDVLRDVNDIDACVLAYSLIQTNNLSSSLTYSPSVVTSLNMDGSITRNGWNGISDWLRLVTGSLTNLESLSIKEYNGIELFDLSANTNLRSLNIDKLTMGASRTIFSTVSPQLETLAVTNSNLSSLEDVSLARLRGLRNLDLSNNNIQKLSYQDGTNVFNIGDLTSIRNINLNNNVIDDIEPLFSATQADRQIATLDLSGNMLTTFSSIGSKILTISSPGAVINLSNNQITEVSEFFSRIRFSQLLSSSASSLASVNLSNNQLTTLPSSAASITKELTLSNNQFSNFSMLDSTAKLERVILNVGDLNPSIWQNQIYVGDDVSNINDEYVKWFIAPGALSSDNNDQLSAIQTAYVNSVLVNVGISVLNLSLRVDNPNSVQVTEADLSSPLLGDSGFDVAEVLENAIVPTTTLELSNFITSSRENVNMLLTLSYTSYDAWQRLIQEREANTPVGLSPAVVGIIIALSIVGILVATGFIGMYFFNLNKKAKKRGEF